MKRQLRGKYLRGEDGSLNEWPAKCPRQCAGTLAVRQCPLLAGAILGAGCGRGYETVHNSSSRSTGTDYLH